MKRIWLVLGLGLLSSSPLWAQTQPKKIAVMRTQTDGVDAGVSAQVSARIAEVARGATGAEVLSADEISTLLEHERDKQLAGCE